LQYVDTEYLEREQRESLEWWMGRWIQGSIPKSRLLDIFWQRNRKQKGDLSRTLILILLILMN